MVPSTPVLSISEGPTQIGIIVEAVAAVFVALAIRVETVAGVRLRRTGAICTHSTSRAVLMLRITIIVVRETRLKPLCGG